MAKGNKEFRLEVPGGENVVLLHTCCAPCSSAIIECMMNSGITPVIYYCNPNIHPYEEYVIRKDECTRYAEALGLEIVDATCPFVKKIHRIVEKESKEGSQIIIIGKD